MTAKKSTPKSEPKAAEPRTLKDATAAGTVRLFRQRKNGTLRSLTSRTGQRSTQGG